MRIAITNISNLGNIIARGIVAGFSAKLIVRNDSTLSGFSQRLPVLGQSARVVVDHLVDRLGVLAHALAASTWMARLHAMWLGMPTLTASPITTPATATCYRGLCYAATKQGQTKRFAKRHVAAG
ncbi:MAG: hypothetical protein RH917_10555 [Lacipirellulaceae bacterium]